MITLNIKKIHQRLLHFISRLLITFKVLEIGYNWVEYSGFWGFKLTLDSFQTCRTIFTIWLIMIFLNWQWNFEIQMCTSLVPSEGPICIHVEGFVC